MIEILKKVFELIFRASTQEVGFLQLIILVVIFAVAVDHFYFPHYLLDMF